MSMELTKSHTSSTDHADRRARASEQRHSVRASLRSTEKVEYRIRIKNDGSVEKGFYKKKSQIEPIFFFVRIHYVMVLHAILCLTSLLREAIDFS